MLLKILCFLRRSQCELAALTLGRNLLVNAGQYKDLSAVITHAKSVFNTLQ